MTRDEGNADAGEVRAGEPAVGPYGNLIPIVLRTAERAAVLKDDRLELAVGPDGTMAVRFVASARSPKQLPRQLTRP